MKLIGLSKAHFLTLVLVSDEETCNYVDLNTPEDTEYEDIDNTHPNTSRGNAQTMETIKTIQNPYYCGDNVQLEDIASGNTTGNFKYFILILRNIVDT